ncbi:MAG TPA: thioredoxin family protein [Thermoanaerobaculia bacterium]|nr:thioredoxin family protein [Thermoanaerobaculia bacterium]
MCFLLPSASYRALLLCASLLVATSSAAAAQGAARDPRFSPIGSYVLLLDGNEVEADFFHSAGHGSILIRTPELSKWIELTPRDRTLKLYPPAAIHGNVDGTFDKLPSPPPEPAGTFELVDDLPKFSVEGRTVTLQQRAHLLGPQTASDVMEYDPSYRARANAYAPANEAFLSRLQSVEEPIVIRVFFGTWCSVCVEFLPHVFKVEELLADSRIRFEYYGIPSDFADPEAQRLEVRTTPTGILFSDGEEIGRISGYSWRYPEVALHNTLASAGKLR